MRPISKAELLALREPDRESLPVRLLAAELRASVIEARELSEGLALALGLPSPGPRVPIAWRATLRELAAHRSRGIAWAAALRAAGLPVPPASAELARMAPELERDRKRLEVLAAAVASSATFHQIAHDRLRSALLALAVPCSAPGLPPTAA